MSYQLLNAKNSENGRSMIEMLGVLAIIGVLSVGGIASFSKAMESYKTNQCIEQISTIIANVKNLGLRQHGSYKGLSSKVAKKMKLIPEDMTSEKDNTLIVFNPFGGTVDVSTGKNSSSENHKAETDFLVTYYSLPKDTCLQIMSKNWGLQKISVIATADAKTMDSTIKSFQYTAASSCTAKDKSAVCTNKQMPLSDATAGCGCGKEPNCAITIWNF